MQGLGIEEGPGALFQQLCGEGGSDALGLREGALAGGADHSRSVGSDHEA